MPAPRWFFRFMYDRESGAWERRRDEPEHRELVERTADELANVVAPPGPVADLGCGPGAHALALARRGYDVVGVDGSPRMVEVARARAARDEVDATFDVHDVSAPLRFADASLGGVLANLVLQHLPHPAAFIAEIRRCLRPGGHLLITAPPATARRSRPRTCTGGSAQRATASCPASSASTTRAPSLVSSREGARVVEADDAGHEAVARCAQPPVQVLGRERRAVAGGSGDQQVPARPEAAPDLGDEGRGMREVLEDEDREDTSERRVREAERRADVVHVKRRVDLVARGSCPRDLDHAR